MARILLYIALTLALLSLGASLLARKRHGRSRIEAQPHALLIPLAIIIGVLPGIANVTSTPIGIGASVVSIVLSLVSLVMLARWYRHRA